MYTQDNPNGPIRSQLDPDRDAKTTPGKWDLSSLPEPVHPPLNVTGADQSEEDDASPSGSQQNSPLPQRYAEMHIDPFLDDDTPENCWGRQI